jgi:signal transduction histidine kinase
VSNGGLGLGLAIVKDLTCAWALRAMVAVGLGGRIFSHRPRQDEGTTAKARVIQDLVDVSRIVTGKLYLPLEPVDLRGPVDAAVEVVRLFALAKNITIDVRPPRRRAWSTAIAIGCSRSSGIACRMRFN